MTTAAGLCKVLMPGLRTVPRGVIHHGIMASLLSMAAAKRTGDKNCVQQAGKLFTMLVDRAIEQRMCVFTPHMGASDDTQCCVWLSQSFTHTT